MKKRYATFEQSQTLKRLGYKEKCNAYYWTYDGAFELTNSICHKNMDNCGTISTAPTLSDIQAWLREKKQLDVLVFNCACGYGWTISKANDDVTRGTTIKLFDHKGEHEDSGMWLSYEAALSAGITKALEMI